MRSGKIATLGDRLRDKRERGVALVAKGALPKPDIARRNGEITRQSAKLVGMLRFSVGRPARVHVPSIEQVETLSHVAQGDR